MARALRSHWPEYLMEGALLGVFMVSAGVFAILLFHPASPVAARLDSALLRRALMGVAMGGTAIAIIYSPWGKQSGAHINPAITLAFFRLGKIEPWDAFFYVAFQFAGGLAGLELLAWSLDEPLRHASVNYVVTVPGANGAGLAFAAELLIAFLLMIVVLRTTNTPRLARFTGTFAGALVALYITFESPLSGMSMNPARTFASALPSGTWAAIWIYFTAPPAATLLAAEAYRRLAGRGVACAKLHHDNDKRCIFRCGWARMAAATRGSV